MSLIKSNSIQIGQSSTATQNFTISVPSSPDGTIKLARGNSGATTADIFSVNGSGAITGATISSPTITGASITSSTINGGSITSGTAVASTSGTAIDFTGIPSWAKRITVMLQGVSTNGTSGLTLRVGTSSGFVTGAGSYLGASDAQVSGVSPNNFSTGFNLEDVSESASRVRHAICTLLNISGNNWMYSVLGGASDTTVVSLGCGSISAASLGGVLDRVRITSIVGTDTFDAGSVNIMYEG